VQGLKQQVSSCFCYCCNISSCCCLLWHLTVALAVLWDTWISHG
jgi:hypothetical protein